MKLLALSENVYPDATSPEDIDDAVSLVTLYEYDAVLIDEPRDVAPLTALVRMRRACALPILCVLPDVQSETRIKFYNAGADIILLDTNKVEINAALSALVRRANGHKSSVITVGNVSVDIAARKVTVDGTLVKLPGKELDLLSFLFMRTGKLVTKEMIFGHLYEAHNEPVSTKIVDVFICKTRTRLAASGADDVIETVWGQGYRVTDKPTQWKGRPGSALDAMVLLHENGRMTLDQILKELPSLSLDALTRSLRKNKTLLNRTTVRGRAMFELNDEGRAYVEELLAVREAA
jgi:two-component system cell cycle response regulator CtrA